MKLYVLVGLPGCGKTTFAKDIKNALENCVHISTDGIRAELYGDESIQGNPREVFRIAHERTKESLHQGYNVIFDATNLDRRSRKSVYACAKGTNTEIVAVYFDVPFEVCCERNRQRTRTVPDSVMKRFRAKLEPPMKDPLVNRVITVRK